MSDCNIFSNTSVFVIMGLSSVIPISVDSSPRQLLTARRHWSLKFHLLKRPSSARIEGPTTASIPSVDNHRDAYSVLTLRLKI
ncbi:hypothetical protein E2C01_008213 [Portunus trituberculatus]|uniref:Uncharacterized protein n=1 Tax=Portunus trituberculatus TaxID=210409 RepID=A0A5B7D063_PORTR|nr:hypothetical protein [Portunus trituberculatus]